MSRGAVEDGQSFLALILTVENESLWGGLDWLEGNVGSTALLAFSPELEDCWKVLLGVGSGSCHEWRKCIAAYGGKFRLQLVEACARRNHAIVSQLDAQTFKR